jgi:2',3'-cyclic-nucleotide 2'-phosphodiesterase (5'-nucleotidase family)
MIKHLNTFLLVILLVFQGCREAAKEISVEGKLIRLDSLSVSSTDSLLENIILVYHQQLDEEMNQIIVLSDQVMQKGTPEGLLNNYVADLVFELGTALYKPEDGKEIDFCILNHGGLRVPLPKGEITNARVFELLPFENEMVVITLDGHKTKDLFDYLARSERGMPVSGIRLEIKEQRVKAVKIQGAEFDQTRNYKILTSDYLAGGGDDMEFFLQPVNYEYIGMKVRDAIILHMKKTHERGEKITSALDGRIRIIQ